MEACSFVTAADVAEALGEPFSEGTNAPANMPSVCNFTAQSGGGKSVSLVIYSPGGAMMFPMMIPSPQEVPGLGDRAAWYGAGRIFGVVKGDTMLTIQIAGFIDEAQCFNAAKQLAEKAAPKL